jgi:ankyrin repeat protein
MVFTTDQLVIFAARSGNLSLLQERVAAGGSVNYIDPRHGAALVEAVRTRNKDVVQWLLENGADPNLELRPEIGPLEIALHHPVPEIVECLLNFGARLRRKARPHYARRLDQCLKEKGKLRKNGAG